MLVQILKRMIERGDTEGLLEKLNIFYSVGQLTANEYTELIQMLGVAPEGEGVG